MKGSETKWEWDADVCDYDPEEEAPWLVTIDGGPVLTGEIKCNNPKDAKLIASAPELLEACKKALHYFTNNINEIHLTNDPKIIALRKAIKKAQHPTK